MPKSIFGAGFGWDPIRRFVLALIVLALATLARLLLDPWLRDYVPFPTFFAAVALVGLYAGTWPAIFTMIAGGIIGDYLFIPPRGSFALRELEHQLGLGLFCLTSLVIIFLAEQVRRSRAALERRNRELEETDRKKDEFISMLGHELRNPLAPITYAVELMRMGVTESKGLSPLDIIQRQTGQLTRLVDDLLHLARINRGRIVLERDIIDLRDVVAQSVESVQPRCTKAEIALTVNLPDEPLWVHADRSRLVQVLDNLLDNACKFTPAGGRTEVTAGSSATGCFISVRDSGAGIAPESIDRLFDAFVQIDRGSVSGTNGLGLGLHLVKQLVEKHDGSVSVESAGPGCGSEFVVRLPSTAPPEHEAAPDAAVTTPGSARRLLIIDDNVDAGRMTAALLERLGHTVAFADGGRSGLAEAERLAPDVALIDLRMPEIDGFEVARRLRQRFGQSMRLIALTGFGQPKYREQARLAGFDDLLVKPPSVEQLAAALGAGSLPVADSRAGHRGN